MFGNVMGNLLKKVVQEVQNKNKNNPNVKTAPGAVFENILSKFKKKQAHAEDPATSYTPAPEAFCDDLCNDLNEVQQSNAADPNMETADKSVYEDMKAQLEEMKKTIASQAQPTTINSMPKPNLSSVGMSAVTNSNSGSLGLRAAPDMGAPVHEVRIPEYSKLQVLEYSENSVVLDGTKSRFAKVDFNGQQGWVLESYLAMD